MALVGRDPLPLDGVNGFVAAEEIVLLLLAPERARSGVVNRAAGVFQSAIFPNENVDADSDLNPKDIVGCAGKLGVLSDVIEVDCILTGC